MDPTAPGRLQWAAVNLRPTGNLPGELRFTAECTRAGGKVDRLTGGLTLSEERRLLQLLLDRAHHRGERLTTPTTKEKP